MTTPVVPATVAYEYLDRALQMLDKPRPNNNVDNSWIQHAEAIKADGTYCMPEDEQAVAWCTIGVVKAVTHYDPNPDQAYTYLLSLLNMANPIAIANDTLPNVNDTNAYAVVRNMFIKAMNLAIRFQ